MKSAPSVAVALLLMICSALAAPAQEPPAAPKAAPVVDSSAPSSKDPRFKATLVILEADWSKAPTAKQIEQDLQAALKDVPVPGNLRQNLTASGALILFAPEQVHAYRPEDLSDLFLWLEQHKLVKTRIDYDIPDLPANAPVPTPDDEPELSVDLELLPVSLSLPPPPPFVRRCVQLRWYFYPGRRDDLFGIQRPAWVDPTVTVRRRLVVNEEYAGTQDRTQRNYTRQAGDLEEFLFEFTFPKDRVAAMHAFPHDVHEPLRMSLRAQGVEAAMFVRDASLAVPALEGHAKGPGAVRIPEVIRRLGNRKSLRLLSVSSGDPPQSPPAPITNASSQPVADQLKIFSLIHLDAKAAASIVSQLFGRESAAVAVDERGNNLIMRGDEAMLGLVEAVLLRLDEEPAGNAAPKTSLAQAKHPADVESHAAKYRELEKHAAQTAAEHQQLRAKYADSHPQVKASKDRLRQQVTAAFEARQQWQNAELDQLRGRLAAIEQSVAARERIRDTIIERRVEDLLDPDLHWARPGTEPAGEKKHDQSAWQTGNSSPALPSQEGSGTGPQWGGKTYYEWLDVLNTERKPELIVEALEALDVIGGETVTEDVGRATLRLMRMFMRDDGQFRFDDPNGRALRAGTYVLFKLPSPALAALMVESLGEGDARGRWYPTLFVFAGHELVPEGKAPNPPAFAEFRKELSERTSRLFVAWLKRLKSADPDERHWMFQTAARLPWYAAAGSSPRDYRRWHESHLHGDDKDAALLSAMVLAQMLVGTPDLVDRLIKALDDPDLPRQDAAITALGVLGEKAGPSAARLATLLDMRWKSVAADRGRGEELLELHGTIPLKPGQPECVIDALAGRGPAAKDALPVLRKITCELPEHGTPAQSRLRDRLTRAIHWIEKLPSPASAPASTDSAQDDKQLGQSEA